MNYYCISADIMLVAIIVWQYVRIQDFKFERDFAETKLEECQSRPATRVYDDGTISVDVQVVSPEQ